MQQLGTTTRLHELLETGDTVIEGYVRGILANMREVVIAAATVRQLDEYTRAAATTHIQACIRRWRERAHVRQRLEKEGGWTRLKQAMQTLGLEQSSEVEMSAPASPQTAPQTPRTPRTL